jgi:mRNA-degrading endonuclease RelE of RelBE toxin-antitoxin system
MNYELHPQLDGILKKLSKKDKSLSLMLLNKIHEILNSQEVEHYKNLRSPLEKYKRVHISKRYVLIFRHYKKEEFILFRYFEHRDYIYKNKYD